MHIIDHARMGWGRPAARQLCRLGWPARSSHASVVIFPQAVAVNEHAKGSMSAFWH